VAPGLVWVADFGLLHEPPPLDLLVGPPDGAELGMEQSIGGSTGLHGNFGPWTLQADGYFRTLQHVTGFEQDGSLGQGQGEAYGLETWTRYQKGRIDAWISYTWSRSLRREEAGLPWQPSATDQPHTLVAVGVLDLGKSWTLSGRFRFSSGLPTPNPVPDVVDLLTGNRVTIDPNSSRLEPFHALDFKLSRTFAFRNWGLQVYLDVQNVYDRRIPEPVLTTLSDTYPTWVVSWPTLPILGLEGSFH
jgi:hypothetical protein